MKTLILLALAALSTAQAAEPETLTLVCDGTADSSAVPKSYSTSMGIVIDFAARTIAGFDASPGSIKIAELNEATLYFGGDDSSVGELVNGNIVDLRSHIRTSGSARQRKTHALAISGRLVYLRAAHIISNAILALNFSLKHRPNPPGKDSEDILSLSTLLNRLGEKLFSPEERSDTFRDVNGVYMKLMNFRRLDPQYTAEGRTGLVRGAKAEEEPRTSSRFL